MMLLLYIVLGILVLLLVGLIYQWVSTKRDGAQFPAPGQLVEINGRKLHVQIDGPQTGPVVVFDHGCGIGSGSMIWNLVKHPVSKFARVITYDRAGYGWSDPGPFPRTNEAAVEDLRLLLEKINIKEPVILVGHSYGGINVRLFAKKYPDRTAGNVLVDSTHEDELTTRFPDKYVKGQLMGQKMLKVLHVMGQIGILRILGKMRAFKQLQEILHRFPSSHHAIYQSTWFLNKTTKAVASEFAHLSMGYEQVRGASLGSMPLVVIKSGIVENLDGFSEGEKEATEKALCDLAVEMSQLSTNGELWTAKNSGHNVHVENPDLVADAIKKIGEAATSSAVIV
ncbi:alpha/beta fold hydrolase [Neobacillus sp. Marseille-QA0830]